MGQLKRDIRFWICGLILMVITLAGVLAPLVVPMDPNALDPPARLSGPSTTHPLGADELGRDVLSRLIYGARLSMVLGLASVTIAAVGGTALGLIAGYSGGMTELLLMRLIDAILSFPPILLALFVVQFIGSELRDLILTIGVLYIPRFARVIHAVTLSIRHAEYVQAARAVGSPPWRIMGRTILPNVMAPLIVQFSLNMGNCILLESSLSFLGLGPQPPSVSWGRMISRASVYMDLAPHVVIWPSIVVSATIVAFSILGDALRDAQDPRLRGR